jgi:hypothetical protein
VDTHALLAEAGARVDHVGDILRLLGTQDGEIGRISHSTRKDEHTGLVQSFTFGEGPQAGPYLAAAPLAILRL